MLSVDRPRRPWSLDEYHRMLDCGLLAGERVELIEGEVVQLPAHNPSHSWSVMLLTRLLSQAFGDTHYVRCQLPVQVPPHHSEPEPDLALLRLEEADKVERHPTKLDLVIEVSDSTLGYDRVVKARLYAQAGIPEYWIVNLVDRCLEVHLEPDPDQGLYRLRRLVTASEQVTSGGKSLAVAGFFPPQAD